MAFLVGASGVLMLGSFGVVCAASAGVLKTCLVVR